MTSGSNAARPPRSRGGAAPLLGIVSLLFQGGVAALALLFAASALQTPRGAAGAWADFGMFFALFGGFTFVVPLVLAVIGLTLGLRARAVLAVVVNAVALVIASATVVFAVSRLG